MYPSLPGGARSTLEEPADLGIGCGSSSPFDPDNVADETLDLFDDEAAEPVSGCSNELDLLALARIKGVGASSLSALVDRYPRLSEVWRDDPQNLIRTLTKAKTPAPQKVSEAIAGQQEHLLVEAERLQSSLRSRGISYIQRGDKGFPEEKLSELQSPPRWLFVEGDIRLLHRRSSGALVGTRKASAKGRAVAERCAEVLVESGFSVVSGLADGIDDAAHAATVELNGPALAVIGTGILLDFPATTAGLRRRIVDSGGAVVSEYLPETRYSRQTFVMRNRLIAALSSVVIPVEGAIKSGTAHTVRFARELGRALATAWYGNLDQTNSLPASLQQEGVEFFDLASQEGTAGLTQFLSRFSGDAIPLERDREALFKRVYGPALRELWRAVQRRPPDEATLKWLEERFDSLLEKAKDPSE